MRSQLAGLAWMMLVCFIGGLAIVAGLSVALLLIVWLF